jgi:glycosyltransferase involved in cell wall biosynthesis
MNILHVPYSYYPAVCGGTEVYVRSLIRELALLGVDKQVVVPATKAGVDIFDEVKVHRLAMSAELTQSMLYGAGDPVSAAAFAQVLEDEKPDLVHFHAYSPSVSVLWLEAARDRGIPCVYTYHTPTLACGRGTLMRWGAVPCDGEMTPLRCAACTLHGLGLSALTSWMLALASPATQRLSARVPFRIWPLMKQRTEAVRQWLDGMTRVVALCEWGREVMLRNKVLNSKLRVVRHGLAAGKGREARFAEASQGRDSEALRVVFFGRLDRTKGLQVLVEALRLMPEVKVELHCHLIRDQSAEAAMSHLLHQMQSDARVRLHPPVSSDEVVRTMSRYDAVAVPSIWLETGPLVVLEAFEAGVPVLGSRLGGIAEWVTHERDGLLFPPDDVSAWGLGLKRFVDDPGLRAQLRAGVSRPPSMADVARTMHEIYSEILN